MLNSLYSACLWWKKMGKFSIKFKFNAQKWTQLPLSGYPIATCDYYTVVILTYLLFFFVPSRCCGQLTDFDDKILIG